MGPRPFKKWLQLRQVGWRLFGTLVPRGSGVCRFVGPASLRVIEA